MQPQETGLSMVNHSNLPDGQKDLAPQILFEERREANK